MLLNIFFDNMNSTLELVLIGAFIFAIYWFILRKYNTLGLRLFVLCFLLFIASCTWIYKDEKNLKSILKNGEEHVATIVSKSRTAKDNEVQVSFTDAAGHTVNTKTSEYISKEEWENFETGKPLSILYETAKKKTTVQQSIMRFKNDKIYLYFFSGFWLLLGIVLYIWLRKYRVGVDESGNEWLIREDGSTFLDERKSQAARTAKHVNILSKMMQTFGK